MSTEIIKLVDGYNTELRPYSNDDVVLKGHSIEDIRVRESEADAARIVGSYIIQANRLLNEKRRMDVSLVGPVSKAIINGSGWKLRLEEISNILLKGASGGYGNFYHFDMGTIGAWINSYLNKERDAIFADKEALRERKRSEEMSDMGENHRRLYKAVLGEEEKEPLTREGYAKAKAEFLKEKHEKQIQAQDPEPDKS